MVAAHSPLDVLRRLLDEHGWVYVQQSPSALQGMIHGESGIWSWLAYHDDAFLTFNSTLPINIPKPRRAAAMEYLTRANFGLRIATFELDLSDGQTVCRTSLPIAGVTAATVEHLVFANVAITDRYLPGLMQVVYGKIPPAKAIRDAEGKSDMELGSALDVKRGQSDLN